MPRSELHRPPGPASVSSDGPAAIQSLAPAAALQALGSSPQGLSAAEAAARLRRYGPNQIQALPRQSLVLRFLRQFTHFFALVLWVAVALCLLAQWLNPASDMLPIGLAILGVILINGVFSFVQEYKAEQTLAQLRGLMPERCLAMRQGRFCELDAAELVPGDLVQLREGDKVPADLRLLEAEELMLNVSALTGESAPVSIGVAASSQANPLRAGNLAFSGTFVVKGQGRGLVFATGMASEYGRIAGLTQAIRPGPGHIQTEIAHSSRVISLIALIMGLLCFALGSLRGIDPWHSFVFALGIIVANVPEGLLPTVTLALAMGTRRMARKQFLVRDLNVIENLGAVTVIATDKTGTVTQNRMSVTGLYDNRQFCVPSQDPPARAYLILGLCHGLLQGETDPTEAAIGRYIERREPLTALAARYPRLKAYPFDYRLRRMSVVHQIGGQPRLLCKGSFDAVLACCERYEAGGEILPLDEAARAALAKAYRQLGRNGYRLLGLALGPESEPDCGPGLESGRAPGAMGWNPHQSRAEAENGLIFCGMVALIDPPREEVHDAVARCREAGIRVVMMTGDSPFTAAAIARQVGIIADEGQVTSGEELDATGPDALQARLRGNHVFAMISPEHKLRIVTELQAMGEIVAVTGDGVNDAPALRRADVGVAMGSGTDLAKEVAAAVLLDDHFATLLAGVEEGRAVFGNIRKFITYILASNVPELVPYIAFFLWNLPLALTVPLILAIDLGTDLLPALALGTEAPESDLLCHPPRRRSERLLSPGLFLRAYGFLGLIEAILAMGVFLAALTLYGLPWTGQPAAADPAYRAATSLTLAAIVFAQIGTGFACRSETLSLGRIGLLSNRLYLGGILYELGVLVLITELPWLQGIFGTAPLDARLLPVLIAIPPLLILLEEARKAWRNRRQNFAHGDLPDD